MSQTWQPHLAHSSERDASAAARESRLEAIRAQALASGTVDGVGIRPVSSPIPVASVETGYYGIHMLKEPQWSWEIPVYFFAGGAAGACAVVAQFAAMTGADAELVTDARTIAAIGALLSPALLVSDLGVPSRFLNMLRVFKVQSPMSVGVYIVSVFSPMAVGSRFAAWLRGGQSGGFFRVIENAAGLMAALFGLGMATYTGVLIGATAVPVWNKNVDSLPVHFAISGLGAGVSAVQLMGHEDSRALNILGITAALGETMEGVKLEADMHPVNEPLKKGISGAIVRAGGLLSGPVPLALRLAAAVASERRAKQLTRIAAVATVAGSFFTRVGWVRAGHASARDYRIPLGIAPGQRQAPKWLNAPQKRINDSELATASRNALGRSD